MIEVSQLEIIINISANRNCGYHSFILGLKKFGKQDKFEIVANLRCNLYKHGEESFQKLRHHVIYGTIPKRMNKEM